MPPVPCSVVALLRNSTKTEPGAGQFLDRLALRAASFALLGNSRKTECGAGQFLDRWRCAPHPLRFLPVAVQYCSVEGPTGKMVDTCLPPSP
jgi:hypothetical protein